MNDELLEGKDRVMTYAEVLCKNTMRIRNQIDQHWAENNTEHLSDRKKFY
jgi:hypothetical protein